MEKNKKHGGKVAEEKKKDVIEEMEETLKDAEDAAPEENEAEVADGGEKNCEDQDAAEGGGKNAEGGEQEADTSEELNAKYLRLLADFQNYKRRTESEKSDVYARATERVVTDLLEVLDNFDRALEQEDAGDAGNFREGMSMIYKQLMNVLGKIGLSEIEALGNDFDPNFHNAMLAEDTDEYESGKVSSVFQKGYMLNGRVIRPAAVKVAK